MLFSRLLKIRSQLRQSVRLRHVEDVRDIRYGEAIYKGQNLPFDISDHRLFAIKMVAFLASAFAIPFIIVRYQLIKASGGGGGGKAGGASK